MSMSLALYMDVHVPMAITEALRRKGLDILNSFRTGSSTCLCDRHVAPGELAISP